MKSSVNVTRTAHQSRGKKRPKHGRIHDASKRIRAMSHVPGEDCKCKKQCYTNISKHEHNVLIREFNLLGDKKKQSARVH